MDIMRQSACLIVNPITVHNYAILFNCTIVAHVLDSMMSPWREALVRGW